MKINWELTGGLNREHLDNIHQKALEIIRKIGIETVHTQVLEMLKNKPGVMIKGERVCLEPALTEELLDLKTLPKKAPPAQDFQLCTTGYALNVMDLEDGRIRKSTVNDLKEMIKLADSMNMPGNAPIFPQDLPQPLAEIATYKIGYENSRNRIAGSMFSSFEVLEFILRMQEVVTGRMGFGMHMISPLKFDPFLLDLAYRLKDKPSVCIGVGTMPALGLTAPVFIIAALVQALAEILGGAAILKLLSPKKNVGFGPWLYSSDMLTGNFILGGSPEHVLVNLLLVDICRFYGMTATAKTFSNMAKDIDVQAGLESSLGTMLMAMKGVRSFGYAGILSADQIYSGAWLVIQNEIFEYVKRLARDYQENLSTRVIEDCALNIDYIRHASTVENYRQRLWSSPLFNGSLFSQTGVDARTIKEKAGKMAREKIAGHNFQLAEDKSRALNKIWEEAMAKFGGGRLPVE